VSRLGLLEAVTIRSATEILQTTTEIVSFANPAYIYTVETIPLDIGFVTGKGTRIVSGTLEKHGLEHPVEYHYAPRRKLTRLSFESIAVPSHTKTDTGKSSQSVCFCLFFARVPLWSLAIALISQSRRRTVNSAKNRTEHFEG